MITTITEGLSTTLRAIASGLQYPVILALMVLAIWALVELGSLLVELFTDHRHLKAQLPKCVDDLHTATNLATTIQESQLLKTQKTILLEITQHPQLPEASRTALAEELLEEQEDRYAAATKRSDLIAKLGPMFGLLGTLIPLGPGIIALGQGDTYTLSLSLLTAFDTTVLGLITAAVAVVVASVRKKWYKRYMDMLRALMECVLEEMAK
jgi:biopolymer transport protein ExbB/TolQ